MKISSFLFNAPIKVFITFTILAITLSPSIGIAVEKYEEQKYNDLLDCPIFKVRNESSQFKASFTQKRFIRGIKKPLESNGLFSITAGEKIEWHTIKPFENIVRIDTNGFQIEDKLSTDNGSNKQQFDSIYLKKFSSLLLSLHSLSHFKTTEEQTNSLKKIQKELDLACYNIKDNDSFLLRGTPNSSSLSRILSDIQLKGKTYPEEIEIKDGRGDKTIIFLKEIKPSQTIPGEIRDSEIKPVQKTK